jgi:hypothetical protein
MLERQTRSRLHKSCNLQRGGGRANRQAYHWRLNGHCVRHACGSNFCFSRQNQELSYDTASAQIDLGARHQFIVRPRIGACTEHDTSVRGAKPSIDLAGLPPHRWPRGWRSPTHPKSPGFGDDNARQPQSGPHAGHVAAECQLPFAQRR